MKGRSSGILLPIFSLPGAYGIGSLGGEARRFIDFLADAHQHVWQILPLVPTGSGDSPYMSPSAFAGNPWFLDLEDLAALRVTKCVDWHPSDEAAVFCGFDDPVTLTVSYQTDSGAETSFEMKVGTQNMDGTGRYVRFGEEEAIYLMELELLDPLMRLAYQGMDEPA